MLLPVVLVVNDVIVWLCFFALASQVLLLSLPCNGHTLANMLCTCRDIRVPSRIFECLHLLDPVVWHAEGTRSIHT